MKLGVRGGAAAAIIAATILLLGITSSRSAAANLEAQWSLANRASNASFKAGTGPATGGYEIISFDAVGPSDGLETYVYAGADLTPPMPGLVSCTAAINQTTMSLAVGNGYPYAGCVFFLGVENTGDAPIHVSLGELDSNAKVTCDVSGCQASDIDVVAGGRTASEIAANCTGPAALQADGRYAIAPGDTFACPLFVVVLQPAKEGALYHIEIVPPELSEEPLEFVTPQVPNGPSNPENPPPKSEPTATPTLTATPTFTPTPISQVSGAKTPGIGASTPLPPSTGSGVLIQRKSAGTVTSIVRSLVILVIGGVGLALVFAWPSARKG